MADDLEREESSIGEHFDLIICSDVIEHVVRPDNLLSYIHSICHKRSQMILSTPDRDRLRGVHNQQSPKPEHIREWNYEELEAFLVSSDYEVTEHFHQFPMCLSRNSWKTFLRTMAKQILKFRHPKYNQVVLARVSS